MTYIKINDTQYPAEVSGIRKDRAWDDRESKSIALEMDYDTANGLFVDDVPWSIVYQMDSAVDLETGKAVIPEPEEYDNSEYCVAGSITDERNGTVTVKMGKPTAAEMLAELERAYDEQ